MANNLTGNYEAVVQVSTRMINGLLATLHENGLDADKPLKLIHTITLRVGDPRRPDLDDMRGDFIDWVREMQKANGPRGLNDLRADLTATVPPGAARILDAAFANLGSALVLEADPPGPAVRGTVRLQVATPRVSVPAGSTSEVTLDLGIRADYTPDPGYLAVVQPGQHVHGDVHATFEVRQVPFGSGKRLVIKASPQDSKIFFTAASGSNLSGSEVDQISIQVRKALRESITSDPVDLPHEFPFAEFKGLGSGGNEVLALPIKLSGAGAPTGNIQSLNNLFIGPAGFAFAVGRDFALSVFHPTLDSLRQITGSHEVIKHVLTYRYSVTGADLLFHDGWIDLVVKAKATTGNPVFPNYNNIVITQRLNLILFLGTLFIRDDGLTITGAGRATDAIRNAVTSARDQLLPSAESALNTELHEAMAHLNTALHKFDSAATASLRSGQSVDPGASASGAIGITEDGIIMRGVIGGAARSAPVVSIAETADHLGFTALNSWIPAGRLERHVWSWVEYSGPAASIFSGVIRTAVEPHRFILPKPPGITQLSSICLRLEGTQTSADGQVVNNVAGGTTCNLPDFGSILETPSWWEPVTVPTWRADIGPEAPLKESIAGHVSVQGPRRGKNAITHNTLVYFPDWRNDKPLEPLAKAFAQMQRKSFSLVVIVVTPAGTFDSRRMEVEAKLDLGGDRPPALVLPTEDNEGGWTRTFGTTKTPSAYLINALGKSAWTHEGNADPKEIADAMDAHLAPAPAPQSRPLRLALTSCDCHSTDIAFEDADGNKFSLHRLRGREVMLNFWQAWSAPCVKELIRLQGLAKQGGKNAPFIVAFHGGKERKVIEEIRKQHGLTFPLVHDTDHRIARKYGVRCWPTTILINADGQVGHVQFGSAHEHSPARGCKGDEAS